MKPASRSLARVEAALGHRFADRELLRQALTHASAAGPDRRHYERLEFLGDGVLGLVVTRMLYESHPDEREGALSKRRSNLVRSERVAEVAKAIGLHRQIRTQGLSFDLESETAETILGDAMEAVIGALYLDGGLAAAEAFVVKHWRQFDMGEPSGDAKTVLKEWAEAHKLAPPDYRVVGRIGPDHAPQFKVEVRLAGFAPLEAEHGSRRMAELLAARELLTQVRAREAND